MVSGTNPIRVKNVIFRTVAYIKQERRWHTLLAEDDPDLTENLGLMTEDDYFGDSDH